jgi:hypothetical protein
MILNTAPLTCDSSLLSMIEDLEVCDPSATFGSDIDAAQAAIFGGTATAAEKAQILLDWAARFQPCLFGRLGSKGLKGLAIDVCWLDEGDIGMGEAHLCAKLRQARRMWKDRAAEGVAHGMLVMFSHRRLAFARPSFKLLTACQRISDLYFVEHAPIECDVIYTEAMPLRGARGLSLFKAGANVFYPSAHGTFNHDRRIPGGVVISINSPGHYANSLVQRGLCATLGSAVEHVMDLTLRSIGNGGIGHPGKRSTSWHNRERDSLVLAARCPTKRLPNYVPDDYSRQTYSALYHTDVLVPTEVTIKETADANVGGSRDGLTCKLTM